MTASPPPFDFDNLDVNELKTFAQSNKSTSTTTASVSENIPNNVIVAKVLTEIHSKTGNTEKKETVVAVSYLLQRGATSPKMQDAATFTYNSSTVTKAMINTACRNSKITPRQLARAMADTIGTLAVELNWQGNQAKNYKMDNPGADDIELAYASDFQTFNPNCPTDVRNWLIKNFRDRFTP